MVRERSLQEIVRATLDYLEEDSTKSRVLFWRTLFILIFFLGAATSALPWPVKASFSVLAGLTLVRLFIFYHDFLHGAIFQDSPFMKWVMWTFGILILNPPNIWKRSHNYHHQKNAQIATASIGSFPVMTISQYENATRFEKLGYRAARSPFNMLFGYFTIFILGMCVSSFVKDPRKHPDSLLALVVHGALIASLWFFCGPSVLIFGLFIPFSISHSLGAYLFYIQHNFPGVELRPRTDWDYLFAALRSSSFMDGSPLTHWFTGNIGYHHVHHLNARIPFYRLPEVMAAIPELQDPIRTSLSLVNIYRSFQGNLWNPTTNKMVRFPSLISSASPLRFFLRQAEK
jgi:acyl-lipid omega-6 desaturase (Delta-12 desaturase)